MKDESGEKIIKKICWFKSKSYLIDDDSEDKKKQRHRKLSRKKKT